MVSDTRLYGAAIAVVSGGYSLWSASTATAMGTSGWLMALLGVVVIVHGAVLLTGSADRLGDASGPLMIGYSVLMLLNQVLVGTGVTGGMGGGMNGGMDGGTMGGTTAGTAGMGWDAGMVALAILMLVSGVIMTQQRDPDGAM
ncbi:MULTISPECIES: hypothetical protein [Halolamina]|uniref:Uncharacterized protein n=1 Tax=Halolamina pelagica TaxID=699431 RepID=A0A1I5LZ40_9EURY|nr:MULTISPECIES: hypothetical protein [Halolamina]NHX35784.1 hypothetical protein [Halolamina sp. R1-12]SFP02628.1 hypothetical protein SAMN05216277_10118 [Halolamina pelagica]